MAKKKEFGDTTLPELNHSVDSGMLKLKGQIQITGLSAKSKAK